MEKLPGSMTAVYCGSFVKGKIYDLLDPNYAAKR